MRWFANAFCCLVCQLVLVALLGLYCIPRAAANEYICRTTSSEWTWLSDHVATWVDYIIVGAPGRRYEVGTGIFFRNRPWGTTSVHTGRSEVTAYGAGALHVKQADEGAPFKICGTSSNLGVITILKREF